jgi:hypothetical protein
VQRDLANLQQDQRDLCQDRRNLNQDVQWATQPGYGGCRTPRYPQSYGADPQSYLAYPRPAPPTYGNDPQAYPYGRPYPGGVLAPVPLIRPW